MPLSKLHHNLFKVLFVVDRPFVIVSLRDFTIHEFELFSLHRSTLIIQLKNSLHPHYERP